MFLPKVSWVVFNESTPGLWWELRGKSHHGRHRGRNQVPLLDRRSEDARGFQQRMWRCIGVLQGNTEFVLAGRTREDSGVVK